MRSLAQVIRDVRDGWKLQRDFDRAYAVYRKNPETRDELENIWDAMEEAGDDFSAFDKLAQRELAIVNRYRNRG